MKKKLDIEREKKDINAPLVHFDHHPHIRTHSICLGYLHLIIMYFSGMLCNIIVVIFSEAGAAEARCVKSERIFKLTHKFSTSSFHHHPEGFPTQFR